jgi:hypothetical protein
MPRGFPRGAQQGQRIFGEGYVSVLRALTAVAMDLEALAINVRALQEKGFVEPEA